LIPGPDPLRRRVCQERMSWALIEWFSAVEALAWAAVEARYGAQRPDKIFLVLGQTLAKEFSITHREYGSSACEVAIQAAAKVPSISDGHIFLGHAFERVSTATGSFEVAAQGSSREYSLFFETHISYPTKLLKRSLYIRLKGMYR
jgi:hypothetical protein